MESEEQLGGLYLIEADDIEHATVTAEKLAMSFGSIEIRPVAGIDLRGELLVEPADTENLAAAHRPRLGPTGM